MPTISGASLPQPGQIVCVRQRLYLTESVEPQGLNDDCALVRLACVDDDAQGQTLEVFWEHELDAEILSGEDWNALAARDFDPIDLFAAYRNTLRWNCVTATDPSLFQSPFRAGIRLEPYQLEPLRKALRLPRVNLFIADDVGLGKTIEAGLILRELLLRKKAMDIVIACPTSMILQWKEEMETRFGLIFEILDREYIQRVRQERGFTVNPWTTHSRFLISHRLIADENYAAQLRDWLGNFRTGSVLVLDEAHHAAPASGQRYAVDSNLTRAIRDISYRFEHRLFLSATPHNGHSNSFSALLEILDPQRFCRGVPVKQNVLHEVLVRRLKEDLRTLAGGFPERKVDPIIISGLPENAPELRLCELLSNYAEARALRLSGERKHVQNASRLIICNLQKRLLSSIEAFARTLAVHRRTLEKPRGGSTAAMPDDASMRPILRLLEQPDADDDQATQPEETIAAEQDQAMEALSTLGAGPATTDNTLLETERTLLQQMEETAQRHRACPDARIEAIVRWMQEHMCAGAGRDAAAGTEPAPWTATRLLIFTEYDDTKRYLEQQLRAAIDGTDRAMERLATFQGSTSLQERERIKHDFNASPAESPLRILVATDAAREGLNLQATCRDLFHFDVPWNPSRMEQRNGRIDRKLQPASEVFCRYFVYSQRPEDRVLNTLVKKSETIRKELGSLPDVLNRRTEEMFKAGIRRSEERQLTAEIGDLALDSEQRKTIDEELEAARERKEALAEQIKKLEGLLDQSRRAIGFRLPQFEAAISCSLRLLNAPPLERIRTSKDGDGPVQLIFPPLDRQMVGWGETMDSLRAPRREEKLLEWRRDSPIRPVVFEDPGVVTEEVVQLHLEQRVVQRLLARFRAQGFIHHDLSRACLAHSFDGVARVVLLGRLALYGPGAARLHEEIVPVTARWIAPAERRATLAPYARDAEARTLQHLDMILGETQPAAPPTGITTKLKHAAPLDIHDLLPHLELRAAEYAEDAKQKLMNRADAEASAMRKILRSQQDYIRQKTQKHDEESQLSFKDFDIYEKKQLEANRKHWDKRLAEIEKDLNGEPIRIRQAYEIQATRVEPVGLIYLWPMRQGGGNGD